MTSIDLSILAGRLRGSVATDRATLLQYATDASIYRRIPAGVVVPIDESDVMRTVQFAAENGLSLIPRAAGTSLAGQVVGEGLVVDFSCMNRILEVNQAQGWVRVQPGVIRDELNYHLADRNLFFSPTTSTSNRCMIGGMVGNNSSGTTSIKYGVTRDKILEVRAVLADGTVGVFGNKSAEELREMEGSHSREAEIHRELLELLGSNDVRQSIRDGFPKREIHRRNTGYALDALIDMQPFSKDGTPLNLAKVICGSEGTLCMVTEVKLKLDELPPKEKAVVCAHFRTVGDALKATVVAMEHEPYACELMDGTILELTKKNPAQAENRFFVDGDPGAVLCVEMRGTNRGELEGHIQKIIADLSARSAGTAYPVVYGDDTDRVWALRAAGLGVLSNMSGDAKPVAFIEDTAVALTDLPQYISDFDVLMKRFGKQVVYYAHAGAGELHLRPVLNLKDSGDRRLLREIGRASAELVAKYGGSLSGEHGDGRVRGEFIKDIIGMENYRLCRRLKAVWDPHNLFNPGKIVDALPMDTDLRYEPNQVSPSTQTFLDFSADGGALAAAERCNGSGDCRKLAFTGATMCPSYQATRRETDSTRARANVLREALTRPVNPRAPFTDEDAVRTLDLCLSCKACQRECPSNVDMALLKAETMYRYQEEHGYSRSARFFGEFAKMASRTAPFAAVANKVMAWNPAARVIKRWYGVASQRSLPRFASTRATKLVKPHTRGDGRDFLLYIDEFTEFQDAEVALAAAQFFQRLGYRFEAVFAPSGRPPMSKGMLAEAKRAMIELLDATGEAVEAGVPVVGLEPSALLGLRDDLPKLLRGEQRDKADALKAMAMTFEEFTAREMASGRIAREAFDETPRRIHLHTHCHQKAISHVRYGMEVLGFPRGHEVINIPSGCCGMAGSFGYEKDHYEVSMKIGEMVLFPRVRQMDSQDLLAAAGTSCRHQIIDGTGSRALHPAEIMLSALKP